MAHAWNPNTQEAEAGGSGVQDKTGLKAKSYLIYYVYTYIHIIATD
jgi:hypothetical protein